MKFSIFFLLLILSSCADKKVYLKHPTPKMRIDQKGFNPLLYGEYVISDSTLDRGLFNAVNEVYKPKISLPTDTSVFITFQSKIILSENRIILKEIYTGYMFKSLYESVDKNQLNENDSLIFIGDTVKFILKANIDTLFNLENKDILRKYKDYYVLNKWHEEGYQPIILSRRNHEVLDLMDLKRNNLSAYYWSFDSGKINLKGDFVNNGEPINLKNSELKKLINNNCFTLRFSTKKEM